MPTAVRPRLIPALVLALVQAGCVRAENGDAVSTSQNPPAAGSPGPAAASGRTPRSPTDPPTLRRPTGPPEHPTDQRKPGTLAGRISRGGDGPCYGLVTDDGREYALYGPDLGTWPTGTWVRVTVGPAPAGVDCGPGRPVRLLTIERIA